MPEVRVELRDTTNNVVGDIEIFDSNSFPLALTYSNFDMRDLGSRKGSFSKSFKIPATKGNNTLLKHLYFDGYVDTKGLKGRKPATIYVDNLPIMTGQLQVTKVMKSDVPEEYECVFFGDNMDWASVVKELELRDLSFTNPNPINVDDETQWEYNNPTNGKAWGQDYEDVIVYPLCSFGEGDSTQNAVLDSDFLPHIFVKSVFDSILDGMPNKYSYSSTFLDSDFFKGLVMPLQLERDKETIDMFSGKAKRTTDEQLINVYSNSSSTQPRSIEQASIQGTNATTRTFWFKGDDEDDSSLVNTGFSNGNIRDVLDTNSPTQFYAGEDGVYNCGVQIDLSIETQGWTNTVSDNKIKFFIKVEGYKNDAIWTDFGDSGVVNSETWDVKQDSFPLSLSASATESHTLIEGDYIQFKITVNQIDYAGHDTIGPDDSGNYQVIVTAGSNMEIQASPTISMGDLFTPSQILPKGKQLDFIKGISQLFNLQFYTDAASRVIHIEPYDHFYLQKSKSIDWSDKIDKSRGVEDEFIHDIKKNIVFGYGDTDAMSERFNKKNAYEYGAYKEIDTSDTFLDGTYEVRNDFFTPTYMLHEGDYVESITASPLIPVYWKSYSSPRISLFHKRPDKTFDTGTRILYYRTMSSNQSSSADSATGAITGFDYLGEELSGTPTHITQWGRAVFIDWDNYTDTVSNGYENVGHNLSFTSITDGTNTLHGLYKHYYSKMTEQLKGRPRIRSVYVKLNAIDVMNFDFRTLIYIDGVYYRVNKIVDFKPHRNESTKVELTEFLELGSGSITTQTNDIFI